MEIIFRNITVLLYILLNECSLGEQNLTGPKLLIGSVAVLILCCVMQWHSYFQMFKYLLGLLYIQQSFFLVPTDNHNKLCKLVGLQAHTLFTKFTFTKYKQQFLSLPGNSSGKVTSYIPQFILMNWKPNSSLQLDGLWWKILDTCVRYWLAFLCWTALAERFQQRTLKGQLTPADKMRQALRILLKYILGYQTNPGSKSWTCTSFGWF